MKRFFKLFFSRITLIALAIALQVGVMAFFATYLTDYSVVADAVAYAISIVVVISIVNRNTLPDNKIAWIVIVTILPIFGTITYLIFGQNLATPKQQRLFRVIRSQAYVNESMCMQQLPDLKEKLGNYYGQTKYLLEANSAPTFTNTENVYFGSGEAFFEDITQQLKSATKYIFMEYFILEEGKMFNSILKILRTKVNEGVEVRLMYDDVGCVSKVKGNYYKTLCRYGIKCVKFAPLSPIASAVHNNRDHRKITVIDGKVGYVGGINLADEYINEVHPFGYWKDSAVRLRGEGVRNLIVMFLQMYDMTTGVVDNFDDYIPSYYEHYDEKGFVVPFCDGPKPLYREHIAEKVYLNIINQAQHTLYITTPYLIADEMLTTAIISASMRGVDVKIVTPAVPDKKMVFLLTRGSYERLMKAGVEIYQYTPGFIHAKNIIADDTVGIVGTINIDYRSMVHHYECGVYMVGTCAIRQLKQDFEEVLNRSQLQTTESAKQNFFAKLLCKIVAVFRPLL